jgi:hypothetical protein
VSFCSVTRMLALEEQLSSQNWECAFWANPHQIDRFPSDQPILFKAPSVSPLESCDFPITSCDDLLSGLGLNNYQTIKKTINNFIDVLQTFQPDIVVTDLSPIAIIASKFIRVPIISAFRWTYHPRNPDNQRHSHPMTAQTQNAINLICKEYGIGDYYSACNIMYEESDELIIPSIPPFENDLSNSRRRLSWLGLLASDRLERRDLNSKRGNQKKIYVYIDPATISVIHQYELFSKAFCHRNWKVSLAIPPNAIEAPNSLSNMEILTNPPGRSMIEQCDVYVTHGGSNSLLLALFLGKPVVTVPGDSIERLDNAMVLANFGIATILNSEVPTASDIYESCKTAYNLKINNQGYYWQKKMQSEYPGSKGIIPIIRRLTRNL